MPDAIYLSIIIPAFTEERRLPDTLRRLTDFLNTQSWTWEIRVVDDGSPDGTGRVVDEAARSLPNIVLQREPHRGKGGAVRAGLMAARGQMRFMCDADLSMPPEELPRFLPPAQPAFARNSSLSWRPAASSTRNAASSCSRPTA